STWSFPVRCPSIKLTASAIGLKRHSVATMSTAGSRFTLSRRAKPSTQAFSSFEVHGVTWSADAITIHPHLSRLRTPNCRGDATRSCQFFYDCLACGTRLLPAEHGQSRSPGDCCVFCSTGQGTEPEERRDDATLFPRRLGPDFAE